MKVRKDFAVLDKKKTRQLITYDIISLLEINHLPEMITKEILH